MIKNNIFEHLFKKQNQLLKLKYFKEKLIKQNQNVFLRDRNKNTLHQFLKLLICKLFDHRIQNLIINEHFNESN